jgi:hypothetical protein
MSDIGNDICDDQISRLKIQFEIQLGTQTSYIESVSNRVGAIVVIFSTSTINDHNSDDATTSIQQRGPPIPIHSNGINCINRETEQAGINMGQIISSLLEIFYTKKLDIVVIGLENR